MNVLAVDPGGVTGLALWYSGEFTPLEVPDGFTGMADWLRHPYRAPAPPDHIVIESFTVNASTHKKDPGMFRDTTSIIGAVRFYAHPFIPVTFQSPQQAKQFVSDDRLRHLGWYTPSKGGHANDATRHLVTFLAQHRDPDLLRRLTRAGG